MPRRKEASGGGVSDTAQYRPQCLKHSQCPGPSTDRSDCREFVCLKAGVSATSRPADRLDEMLFRPMREELRVLKTIRIERRTGARAPTLRGGRRREVDIR